jgi:type II secretory pathway pseudopilin PulG
MGDGGFTIVEVLVAVVLLLIGIFAAFALLDSATRATLTAKRHQVAVNQLQRELESIRRLKYEDVGLSSNAVTSSDPDSPNSRVSGNNFDVARSTGTTTNAQLVEPATGTTGLVSAGPTSFTTGNISGKVYRYVVWQDDPGCLLTCPGTQDYKRVIVAVKIDGLLRAFKSYAEVQSNFANPNATVIGDLPPVNPDPGSLVTAQQFWLYDSPCSGNRVEPSANHATHNTTGDCGATNPADLMWTSAPPDSAPNDPAVPSTFNYSTDLTGGTQGLRMLARSGCNASETNPNKIHRWETKPLPLAFSILTSAHFNFFTKSTGGTGTGKICIRLVRRTYVLSLPVDTVIGTRTWQNDAWPSNSDGWTALDLDITTVPTVTLINDRIVLELFVDSASAISPQFLYDHPNAPSRLEVATSTPF